MNQLQRFGFLVIVSIISTAKFEKCPKRAVIPQEAPPLTSHEKEYAETISDRSKRWLDEVSRQKRHTLKYETPAIIPKHLINDTESSYTHIQRKEYRHMSQEELDIFHNCLQTMKDNGDYDAVAELHHPEYASAAHFGVAFLPWHRQYLLVFEQIIRAYKGCKNFFVPYWDSTLDEMLEDPLDSALWTEEYWGSNAGLVNTGNLGNNWNISERCKHMNLGDKLLRHSDQKKPHLYNKQKILDLFAARTYSHMLFCNKEVGPFSKFELAHGLVHCFVGTCKPWDHCIGHFGCLRCSANDPIFWLLHSFVDSLWDEWSVLPDKENIYPEIGKHGATFKKMGKAEHFGDSPMSPFPGLMNSDGFRQGYYPTYLSRPSLLYCQKDEDCKGRTGLLFCHKCGYCSAKVREGGNCRHLPNKACYCGKKDATAKCTSNKCHCL